MMVSLCWKILRISPDTDMRRSRVGSWGKDASNFHPLRKVLKTGLLSNIDIVFISPPFLTEKAIQVKVQNEVFF